MFCPNPDCPRARRVGEAHEYPTGLTHCLDCGSALLETEPTEGSDQPDVEHDELVPRITFVPLMALPNAELETFVQSLMQWPSISFYIKGKRVQDLFGVGRFGLGFKLITGPPVLFVEPSRAEEAGALLRQLEEPTSNDKNVSP